ncbi:MULTISPECIES: hypothetical protein [unclassified Methylobacterium]|uniref:hypothetical protein n=1 Tax=unclassified Methylobacterium TaxID=2615210 RepID=UPI002269E874|nr:MULTISPECIES: hypothetical protein [unclassified Methylobacterium]
MYLHGEPFDLGDWREEFKPPFDPSIIEGDGGPVLCSTVFEDAVSADDVWQKAKPLIDMLYGALIAKDQDRLPVTIRSIVEFSQD